MFNINAAKCMHDIGKMYHPPYGLTSLSYFRRIKPGYDIDDINIRHAAICGHTHIVKYLAENGADINVADGWPIRNAFDHRHLDVVRYLVSIGADVNVGRCYMLRRSARNGDYEMVKYLISVGAKIDERAIREALNNRHGEIARYLKSF